MLPARRQMVVSLVLVLGTWGCGLPAQVRPDAAPAGDAVGDPTGPPDSGDRVDGAPDGSGCRRLVLGLTANEDEGEIDGDRFYPDGEKIDSRLHMGWYLGGTTWSYFRFLLTDQLPATAQLRRVELQLFGGDLNEWNPRLQALVVHFEKGPDPAVVQQWESRPDSGLTAARPVTLPVRWPETVGTGLAWEVGAYNATPDLSAILGEVVQELDGLPAGSHLQVWVTGEETKEASGEVTTPRLDGAGVRQPRLVVDACGLAP